MSGPQDWITTLGLIAATAAAVGGCAAVGLRVLRGVGGAMPAERIAAFTVMGLCAALFGYRAVVVHEGWAPLTSHVDGLLLLSALLGAVLAWEHWTQRLRGMGLFVMPVLALLTLWGVCASWWSMKAFDIHSVWMTVHLLSVYTGSLGVAIAAAAGAMWLYVDRQLRRRDHAGDRLRILGRMADLESIEWAITRSATLGFVLLTVALATGLVITAEGSGGLRVGWWYSPKVVLAAAVWGIYALVMHVRYVPTFRGRRAAVLSILGFVLLVAVLGLAQALPSVAREPRDGSETDLSETGLRPSVQERRFILVGSASPERREGRGGLEMDASPAIPAARVRTEGGG